jgi:ribosome-binding protein aMBF1 (putative translation factor)
MDTSKRRRLEAAGWKIGSASEFLGLSNQEETLVELKVALGSSLRQQRARKRISQTALAKQLGSSQSRVAKMEAGDASVSFDLQIRALVALGATRKEVARAVASGERLVSV